MYDSVSDAIRDDSGGGNYTAAPSSSQPRTAQPRTGTPTTGGVSQIGGHTLPGSGGGSEPGNVETVSQAYLAALAAMGKNTSGDTSPYVIMSPGAGTGSGRSIGIGTVLVVVALAAGAWWFYKHRQGA